MRPSLAVLAIALLAIARAAPATDFHEGVADYAIDLATPGGTVCWVRPAALRDVAACRGVNVAAAERLGLPGRGFVALVRFPDWSYWVIGGAEKRPGAGLLSYANGRLLWDATVKKATATGEYQAIGSEPEFTIVNDLQALRFRLTARDRSSPAAEMLSYVVFGRSAMVSLMFLTDANHLGAVSGAAWKAVSTVSLPPVKAAPRWGEADLVENAYRRGERLGQALVYAIAIAFIGAVAAFAIRSARRDRAASGRAVSYDPRPKF